MSSSPDFHPIARAWKRVELELSDSESAAFQSLLYLGELLVKVVAAGMVAGVADDQDRRRYSAVHRLVRASGVGEHAAVLDEVLTGPTYEVLRQELRPFQQELTKKIGPDSWQRDAVLSMHETLQLLGIEAEAPGASTTFRAWFQLFTVLRNKTRGHGAPRVEVIASAYPTLKKSLSAFAGNFGLFQLDWAFVRRNLSGKYLVRHFGTQSDQSAFSALKSGVTSLPRDGVYLDSGGSLFLVELLLTDADLSDFYVANGCHRNTVCEFISLITGATKEVDATPYGAPAVALPGSETDGGAELDLIGRTFTNVPPRTQNYVPRKELESRLREALIRDRHEVITLAGPGGAGKTSLALEVCHEIAKDGFSRFNVIVWFSARDIDLLSSGPKTVKPKGVNLRDFAKTYAELMNPAQRQVKGFKPEEFFASELSKSQLGSVLFVFDNFETVASQSELFEWIDAYVRGPNKVLITTRTREFSGDKPVDVRGMTDDEAKVLILQTSGRYGIDSLLTAEHIEELVRESGGHPYVLRMLLGEIASQKRYVKPERLIADEERLLGALFERTYSRLSPAAQLLFLILSSWRSVVPDIALEAVLLLHAPERIDAAFAVDELVRLSLVEEVATDAVSIRFLNVPLAAFAFGKRKLVTSSHRALIEKCVETLQLFGASRATGAGISVRRTLSRFMKSIERKIDAEQLSFSGIQPVLEFLVSTVPELWPEAEAMIGRLDPANYALRANYLRRFLETAPSDSDAVDAWRALAYLLRQDADVEGEVLAYGEIARLPGSTVRDVSEAANRLNTTLRGKQAEGSNLSFFAKRETISRVAKRLEEDLSQLSATDLSRLAWLHLNIGDESKARRFAEAGCDLEPSHEHCTRLLERLGPA